MGKKCFIKFIWICMICLCHTTYCTVRTQRPPSLDSSLIQIKDKQTTVSHESTPPAQPLAKKRNYLDVDSTVQEQDLREQTCKLSSPSPSLASYQPPLTRLSSYSGLSKPYNVCYIIMPNSRQQKS